MAMPIKNAEVGNNMLQYIITMGEEKKKGE